MSEIIILDKSETALPESKAGKLTIIAGADASIPLSLLPALKKKDVTIKTVKDIKDSCEIAFCLGQTYKPGDTLITSRPEFARFKEYAEAKPAKTRAKTDAPAKRTRKPKETPEQKETEKEAEGAMPKPIEAEENKETKVPEKSDKILGSKETKASKDIKKTERTTTQTESKYVGTLGDIEALPTDKGYEEFTAFLKSLGISTAYNKAAKQLYKLAADDTSLRILAQSDLKGLPAEAAKKIIEKIKEMKKL